MRAALAIQEAIAEMNEADPTLALEVRIGVNTGEALVALDARPELGEGIVSGDVVNTGARLQSAAPPGGILVGEYTFRATERAIEYEAEEPVAAKGKAEPLAIWRAIGRRASYGIDLSDVRSPLVGRNDELDVLVGALARARTRLEPQLVTVVGVPGIGKSRLVRELFQVVDADPEFIVWRQGRSLPYGEGSAFWGFAEIVKGQAGILESDGAEEAVAKVAAAVRDFLPEETERAWVERHLLALSGVQQTRSGQAELGESFAAWRRFVEMLAESQPVVLVFEDLHWADDALLDFVDSLADRVTGVPLLVICSARPELLDRRPGWGGGKRNATTVSLVPCPTRTPRACSRGCSVLRYSPPISKPRSWRGPRATRSSQRSTHGCWRAEPKLPRRLPRPCRGSSSLASMPSRARRKSSCSSLPSSGRCSGPTRSRVSPTSTRGG